jgi:site-specific recombinase XerD
MASGSDRRRSGDRRRQFAMAGTAAQETDSNFPAMSSHELIHTAASLAVSAGTNLKAVHRMLGHASAAMMLAA